MRCEEIMNRDITFVMADEPVERAARTMRNKDIGFLPVCENQRKVIGAITDRDIVLRVVADGRPASTPVSQVITPEVIACKASDDIAKAEDLMARHQVSRIMCLDEKGELQGVISLSDIAEREEDAKTSQTLRTIKEDDKDEQDDAGHAPLH